MADRKVTIYWEIKGKSGHGSPTDKYYALKIIAEMNAKYGKGTHWIK